MRGDQQFGLDVIRRLQDMYPTWKMNIKSENRPKFQNNRQFQPQPYVPPVNHPPYTPSLNQQFPNRALNAEYGNGEKIVGQKTCNIMVRQLWLGGIPQNYDKGGLWQLMSNYGIIQDIQIFPKFAFVKYKQVIEATTGFQRAGQIYNRLGKPIGFRVFFSDPSRRAYIVSNHYEFDKQSAYLPILFLGFPPITSAQVDMEVIKPVCDKYGEIVKSYMRKNSNSQNRSYFMFTYDNLKNALRAKQQLNKRKDLLGDKRTEVAILIDQQIIMKGKDFTYTEQNFQSDGFGDKNKRGNYYEQNTGFKQPQYHPMMPPPMGYPMYPPPGPMYPPHYMSPYYPPPPYYYDPNSYYKPEEEGYSYPSRQEAHHEDESPSHIDNFLKDVLAPHTNNEKQKIQKKPSKDQIGNEEDILSNLLGTNIKTVQKHKQQSASKNRSDQKQPTWSGFLTWKGVKRIGVDGHSTSVQTDQYSINIISLIQFKDMNLKQKKCMILQPSNKIAEATFKIYIQNLKSKAGVAMNRQHLMYVMGKTQDSDKIEHINQNELLVVMEKASSITMIKDKLIKCEQLP